MRGMGPHLQNQGPEQAAATSFVGNSFNFENARPGKVKSKVLS